MTMVSSFVSQHQNPPQDGSFIGIPFFILFKASKNFINPLFLLFQGQLLISENSNLGDKLLIKNDGLWSGKNNADDYRNHNIIFYCNPVQGNLTTYNYPVNETGVFKSIVCNQFVSQTYVTISNALYQRIAADNSSAFGAWELK